MRLPDPSTPNLKVDLFQEITLSPRIFLEVDAAVKAKQMKADVNEYPKVNMSASNGGSSTEGLNLSANPSNMQQNDDDARLIEQEEIPLRKGLVVMKELPRLYGKKQHAYHLEQLEKGNHVNGGSLDST
ncbi:hypothetical protein K1719_007688 [Acacia pycnantha]|nr:hypothetical protein K1719_007688 [Acacia pycnantha]